MKNRSSALILTALAVYLLVSAGPLAAAPKPKPVSAEFTRLDALEKAAAAAYNGSDYDAYESRLNTLLEEYRRDKKMQEEIWLLYAHDMDHEAAAREKTLRLTLKTDGLTDDKPELMSSNQVFLVRLRSGIQAIMRRQAEMGRSAVHDVMVYEIDRMLGFHLVPVTVLAEHDKEIVSLQAFVVEAREGDRDFTTRPYTDERMHILDYLTQQLDRHRTNWAVAPGNRVFVHDNTIVYGTSDWQRYRAFGAVSASSPPATITAENRRAVEKLKLELSMPVGIEKIPPRERASLLKQIETLLKVPVQKRGKSCANDLTSR